MNGEELLDLVRQYGSQRYMNGLDIGGALPDTRGHKAAADALFARIAALVAQQPAQPREIVHRVQCAAITRGCLGAFTWEDSDQEVSDRARRLLAANGWRLDHGHWICGLHS